MQVNHARERTMMSDGDFRAQLQEKGYRDVELKTFEADLDGPMHTHDFSVMLLVMAGEFTLARQDGATTFQPGEVCQLDAGTLHAEKTGRDGARVLLGRK
jgi:quercetin dioxygenase-like cupin family protein